MSAESSKKDADCVTISNYYSINAANFSRLCGNSKSPGCSN
jgi:hypothetical protein